MKRAVRSLPVSFPGVSATNDRDSNDVDQPKQHFATQLMTVAAPNGATTSPSDPASTFPPQ